MGAFYFAKRKESLQRAQQAMAAAGLTRHHDITTETHHLRYWHKQNSEALPLYQRDPDNFCLHTGSLLYRRQNGAAAAKRLFEDWSSNAFDPEQLFGNFAVCLGIAGKIEIFNDALGVYPIWHDTQLEQCSSAMPALLANTSAPTLDAAAVYPYVFQEGTFGGDTPIQQIRRLKPGQALIAEQHIKLGQGLNPAPAPELAEAELIPYIHARLQEQFAGINACYGDRIDSALSGGYDSRLLLALCREQGSTPRLHVYGADDSADVLVAKNICDGEQISIKHQNKAKRPELTPEQFCATVTQNAAGMQAFPADSIVDNGADLATRQERTRDGFLLLNGGGGEVLRNFFYLPNLSYTPRQILWSFYSQFDAKVTRGAFDPAHYYQHFEAQISETIGHSGRLSRDEVEWLYPAFRCTYWMGQNNAINNQFGNFLTPLVDASILRAAQQIPLSRKNHGRFEGELIQAISPQLAAYASDYGHDFSGTIPLKRRLKDWATLVRPTWLRRRTYGWKSFSRDDWPYYLREDYISALLPQGFEYMNRYFDVSQVNDARQFKRICTLEYQLQQLNAND